MNNTRVSKYRNKRVVIDGIKFDSKREAKRYTELLLLERNGVIDGLTLQPRYKLSVGGVDLKYPTGRVLTYVADFSYTDNKGDVIEDVKGMRTPVYKIKRAIMEAMGHTIFEI